MNHQELEGQNLEGIRGWPLVYVVGSIPLLMMFSMGLSGWFFEYPLVLMVAIFLLLAVPLLLILRRFPGAPRWNIALLWIMVAMMSLRAISIVFIEPLIFEGKPMSSADLPGVLSPLSMIVGIAIAWAATWTAYFRRSVRVKNTFS
jgi:hypothetical protein